MSANPVLAELVRGNWVENLHRGAFCVVGADGEILAQAGDITRPTFPRSAIKSLQALAIFRSGAQQKFRFTAEELALTCASHHGQPRHIEVVSGMLQKLGLAVDDLECGAHPPSNPEARKALKSAGEKPSALHNNCSGKHAGMLAVALALGAPTEGYTKRDHPVQKLVRDCVEQVIGTDLSEDRCGTDGCSIPTWAAPLSAFALGFHRMTSGIDLDDDLIQPARILFDAATGNPFLVAGTDTIDTDLMTAFEGELMLKIGAEGVFCGALRGANIGFALKCDDGNIKAAEPMVAALIEVMADPSPAQSAALDKRKSQVIKNWRGLEVATLRATPAVTDAFS